VFQHVKDFGHAALKEDLSSSNNISNNVPITAQKISKKDKQKKSTKGVRKNDYRY
jgi:hypothetical protein